MLKPKYLFYALKSASFMKQAMDNKKGVAIRRVVLRDLKELFIKISGIPEQEKVIQEIEYRFTLIENLENSITENLKRIKIYRQVIFQKAFSGNLVPQFENEELASELLRRTKEEIKVYQIQQKEIAKSKPKKLVFMESNKTIKDILKEATEPMEVKDIWQKSVHKDDIEKFYEELKQISDSIEEIRDGKISKLSLKK